MRTGRSRPFIGAALGALVLAFAGCGSDDHPNEPRPPTQITLSAAISDREISLSPDGIARRSALDDEPPVGAGPAVFTVTNQSSEDVTLGVDGPVQGRTDPIPANGGTGRLKLNLREGEYEVVALNSEIDAAPLNVGRERPSSQDDLLLP